MTHILKTAFRAAALTTVALGTLLGAGAAAAQAPAPTAPPAAASHDHEAMKAEMKKKMEASGMDAEAMKAEMKKRMQAGGHDHEAMKAQMKQRMQGSAAKATAPGTGGHSHGSAAAPAATGSAHDHGAATAETAYGRPGDAKKVSRTVTIRMSDAMRFTPSVVNVRQGETIRFVVRNEGRQKHEMVIGTAAELKEHAEAMKKHPDMEHEDHPQAVHLNAGRRGSIVWQFTKAGGFDFACLLPGHFDAGMVGRIVVAPAASPTGAL